MEQQGKVKFFDDVKGFGFIATPEQDYFVHISSLKGTEYLDQGEIVSFVGVSAPKGMKAISVRSVSKINAERTLGRIMKVLEARNLGADPEKIHEDFAFYTKAKLLANRAGKLHGHLLDTDAMEAKYKRPLDAIMNIEKERMEVELEKVYGEKKRIVEDIISPLSKRVEENGVANIPVAEFQEVVDRVGEVSRLLYEIDRTFRSTPAKREYKEAVEKATDLINQRKDYLSQFAPYKMGLTLDVFKALAMRYYKSNEGRLKAQYKRSTSFAKVFNVMKQTHGWRIAAFSGEDVCLLAKEVYDFFGEELIEVIREILGEELASSSWVITSIKDRSIHTISIDSIEEDMKAIEDRLEEMRELEDKNVQFLMMLGAATNTIQNMRKSGLLSSVDLETTDHEKIYMAILEDEDSSTEAKMVADKKTNKSLSKSKVSEIVRKSKETTEHLNDLIRKYYSNFGRYELQPKRFPTNKNGVRKDGHYHALFIWDTDDERIYHSKGNN